MAKPKQRKLTKREAWIIQARVAGYHDDSRAFTRLLVEARVSREALNRAWFQGVAAKQNGVGCSCPSCVPGNFGGVRA